MDFLRSALLGFALLAAGTAFPQQQIEDPLRFGSLRFGMSVDEVRAALPDRQWTVVHRDSETGRVDVVRGEGAVTVGGVPLDLEVGSRRHAVDQWSLESNGTAKNAAACEERTLPVLAELERRFGRFREPASLGNGESRISVGSESFAMFSAADEKLRPVRREKALRKDPAQAWLRSKHVSTGRDAEVFVAMNYERENAHGCRIEVRIEGATPALEARLDSAAHELLLAQDGRSGALRAH